MQNGSACKFIHWSLMVSRVRTGEKLSDVAFCASLSTTCAVVEWFGDSDTFHTADISICLSKIVILLTEKISMAHD